jgi:predicted  nucleic acid-binding Zn-ribbon protein
MILNQPQDLIRVIQENEDKLEALNINVVKLQLNLDNITAKYNELAEHLQKLNSKTESQPTMMQDINTIQKEFEKLKGEHVNCQASVIASLRSDVKELRKDLDDLKKDITTYRESLTSTFNRIKWGLLSLGGSIILLILELLGRAIFHIY